MLFVKVEYEQFLDFKNYEGLFFEPRIKKKFFHDDLKLSLILQIVTYEYRLLKL